MIRSPGGEPSQCCDGRLTALSRPPFRLPRFVCVVPLCWAVFFVAGVLCISSPAKPAVFATADLEPFTPPPTEMQLSPAGARRAEALALFYKGRRFEQGVDEDLALEAYQQAMKLEPENVSLASRMARLMANMGKYNEALAMLESTVTANANDAMAWITLSRHCLRHHHDAPEIKTKALQFARQAVEKFPLRAETYRHLVDTYFQLADLPGATPRDRAREVMDRAAQAKSADPQFWLALLPPARQAYPLDDPETREANVKAILLFAEQAQRYGAEDAEVLEQAAKFYLLLAKRLKSISLVRKALPLLEKISTLQPANLQARHEFASALRHAGEESAATRQFEELVRINPQDVAAHRALVKSAELAHDAEGEITHRLAVLRWEGGEPKEWIDLSEKILPSPKPEEAVSLLKRASLAYPRDARLPYHLALAQNHLQRSAEALESFRLALELTEKYSTPEEHSENVALAKDPDFLFLGAQLASTQPSAHELAATWFRLSMSLASPKNPDQQARCYHGLAALWLDHDEKIDEAGELLRLAQSLAPNDPTYSQALGRYHLLKKDFTAALPLLEKATTAPALALLADALWGLDRSPEAIDTLTKATRLPGATEAMRERLATFREAPVP